MEKEKVIDSPIAYTRPKNEASGIMQKQVDRVFLKFSVYQAISFSKA